LGPKSFEPIIIKIIAYYLAVEQLSLKTSIYLKGNCFGLVNNGGLKRALGS
jgi:hypothetical protein